MYTMNRLLSTAVLYGYSEFWMCPEVLASDGVLFARFAEDEDVQPKCANMNSTGALPVLGRCRA